MSRGTIEHALFLPSARPIFWGPPNNPRLSNLWEICLNPMRDVALQAIDAIILSYCDRSKHRGGSDNS
jgi:hypothetical protein